MKMCPFMKSKVCGSQYSLSGRTEQGAAKNIF